MAYFVDNYVRLHPQVYATEMITRFMRPLSCHLTNSCQNGYFRDKHADYYMSAAAESTLMNDLYGWAGGD